MKRHVSLTRSPMPPRKQRMRARNPERVAKRRKGYRARIAKPDWEEKRQACFARDGYRCMGVRMLGRDAAFMPILLRCEYVDESGTGIGLHAHHRTYARFGRELEKDLTTLCTACHERHHALEGKKIR